MRRASVAIALLVALGVRADENGAARAHAALDARTGELEQCFRGNVAAAMGFNGTLEARFTVDKRGVVTGARLRKGTGLPRYRDQCVLDRVKGMKLPAGAPPSLVHEFVWRGGPQRQLEELLGAAAPADGGVDGAR